MREIIITENDAGQRADRFIRKALPALPDGRMYKYIRSKDIKLNGKRLEISTRLNAGDVMRFYIPDEYFTEAPKKPETEEAGDIRAVYEDENILIVYKQAGLVVHEDNENSPDTLIARITAYLKKKGEYVPENEHSFAPALCNRIDRNTEGLVICAKNASALREMNLLIRQRSVEKIYLCVTAGIPREPEGIIKTYLEKSESENTVYVKKEKTPGAKSAVTEYKVLDTRDSLALCEVRLHTGRTHQIRAHMAYIGCPLLGDGKYGKNVPNRKYRAKSQALCAYKLRFVVSDNASPLRYLDGLTVKAPEPEFVKKYFS